MARQLGLRAMVDPNMSIDQIQQSPNPLFQTLCLHPILGQSRRPLLDRATTVGDQLDLLSQGFHHRAPIQSQDLTPFPGRTPAQLFNRLDPVQDHQPEQQKNIPRV
jgi:hypothetical protein